MNGVPFSTKSIFLFPSVRIIGKAKNRLGRWKRGSVGSDMKNWILLTPNDFNNYIVFAEDYPYSPKTDFSSIENTINKFITKDKIEDCACYLYDSIRSILEDFKNQYEIEEIKYVVECLRKTMDAIYPKLSQSKEAEFLKIISDEILDFYEKFSAKSNS